MKAIVYEEYGSAKNLQLKEAPKPIPKPNEVLIKIHAASVNSWDVDLVKGKPYIIRMGGWFKPKFKILGADISGTIEAIGREVKEFKIGDEVFGDLSGQNWGGFAEYVCVEEKPLARKPKNISHEEAAALAQAAVLALQSFDLLPKIKKGKKTLINGAGGGVGTIAIQLAKMHGLEITAVDRADKLNMLTTIGADHVMDYKKINYTQAGIKYDYIIDNIALHSFFDYRRTLKPDGTFVMTGGSIPLVFKTLVLGNIYSLFEKRKLKILAHRPIREDLYRLLHLFSENKIAPMIDNIFPLEKTPEAVELLGNGDIIGKAIITMK